MTEGQNCGLEIPGSGDPKCSQISWIFHPHIHDVFPQIGGDVSCTMVVQLETMSMNSAATGRKEPSVSEAVCIAACKSPNSFSGMCRAPWTGVDGDVILRVCAWGLYCLVFDIQKERILDLKYIHHI